jgi:hypothetical protein
VLDFGRREVLALSGILLHQHFGDWIVAAGRATLAAVLGLLKMKFYNNLTMSKPGVILKFKLELGQLVYISIIRDGFL